MRPQVICHMMPSVDGRLRTDRWNIPQAGHDEYDRVAATYKADAWVCGRITMEEFADGHWRGRRNGKGTMPREDYVIPRKKGEMYAISLDPAGKLAWKDGKVNGDQLIEVVGNDVADGYLSFLRDRGVAYLFGGKRGDQLDLKKVLRTLREKFGIRKLMLEGGGETNGSFLRAGLIDELSMLLTPVADGALGEPAMFDVEHGRRPTKAVAHFKLKAVRRAAADMLWIRYNVKPAAT